jgi:crossover junction endodeoxyribonuclease RuvC
MKVLSMDLSLSCPAFAVLEYDVDSLDVLHLSHVKTNAKKPHGYRLFQIYQHLEKLVREFPDIQLVVSEKGFSRHPRSTQILYMVHGVVKVLLAKYGHYDIMEITPTTVKKRVAGSGKAEKEDVANAVRKFLVHDIYFETDDESDAVAVGIAGLVEKGLLR